MNVPNASNGVNIQHWIVPVQASKLCCIQTNWEKIEEKYLANQLLTVQRINQCSRFSFLFFFLLHNQWPNSKIDRGWRKRTVSAKQHQHFKWVRSRHQIDVDFQVHACLWIERRKKKKTPNKQITPNVREPHWFNQICAQF